MRTLIIALLLSVSLHSFSQDNDRRERIKALKVAYLTEQLELSKTEAQQFWPVYNTFEEKEHELRKENYSKRKEINFESLSEQEAKKMIDDMVSAEKKKQELRENFIRDLQKILPSKKIIKLKVAEDEFNKKMFEEFKKRKDSKKGKP
ncbi:sensor of ECF-type sigma factor [Subsaxibacter sp. CAU 1640]|uniref:sensor of ECF-type sigma factor n=1 Tax=Subsaxibacter sp. CAU 1640 TaxID=2933271 RepID=UPI0020056305|nr:sensor of ECF-type sigma factor [Subsaxibacter sp. CAU 1640]MCK7589968.1 sensor of ECF-type sigma factor [Subsaxibacter sp. CAU 1640]